MGDGDNISILRGSVLEIAIFSVVSNLLLLVAPIYMIQVYDRIVPVASIDTLIYISLIAFGGLVVLGIMEIVRTLYAARLSARLDARMGEQVFLASMQIPTASIGDVQPLRDLSLVRNFVASRTLFLIFDIPFGPIFICLLYFVHPILFYFTMCGAVVMVIIAVLNQLATRRLARESSERLVGAMNAAQAFARSFETIRVLGMASNAVERWGNRVADSSQAADKVGTINAFYGGLARTFRMTLQSAILGIGGYLVVKGQMTGGMIFASSLVAGRALQPLDQVIGAWRQIVEASAAWKRVKAAFRTGSSASQDYFNLPEPKGTLAVEDLVYFLPGTDAGGAPLIKRLSFSVPAGGLLAIVGPSQAGKSTLVRLIVGAIQPRSGAVRFDGSDIRAFDPDFLGRHIGYLAQETDLLPGTIGDNIARLNPDASEADIVDAAKRAGAHEMVLALPKGYSTPIGPGGVRLSGGERQRIGLARAFFGNPRLIVLDEPNSNLDTEGEKALEAALVTARASGVTVIVVTHRLGLAMICDRTMVLKGGQIETVMTPEEMREYAARGGEPKPAPKAPVVPITPKGASASFASVMRAKPQ